MIDFALRAELSALIDAYISTLDTNQLEKWPDMFVEDCFYEIIPKENFDMGLPAPVIHCDSKKMLRDRVVSLRNANIYAPAVYRHFVSGLSFNVAANGVIHAESSYLVINTSQLGESVVYQTGRYLDEVVRVGEQLRFKRKQCVFDTSRVQTLLALPI